MRWPTWVMHRRRDDSLPHPLGSATWSMPIAWSGCCSSATARGWPCNGARRDANSATLRLPRRAPTLQTSDSADSIPCPPVAPLCDAAAACRACWVATATASPSIRPTTTSSPTSATAAPGTVTVLDLVYLRQDRVLQVGRKPTGMAVNPVRNEVYAANAGSDSISVIDATRNVVAATIGVQHTPYSLDVSPDGKRAYVANSGSNTVSVIDLDKRRVIAAVGDGRRARRGARLAGQPHAGGEQPRGRQRLGVLDSAVAAASATVTRGVLRLRGRDRYCHCAGPTTICPRERRRLWRARDRTA
jgi:YVTN family beta-propeller protein